MGIGRKAAGLTEEFLASPAAFFQDDASRSLAAHSGSAMEPPSNHRPFTFAVIAPYGELSGMARTLAADLPCRLILNEPVALESAAEAARELTAQYPLDAILSRGGSADYIRSAVDVPVISVSTTALDLLRSLSPFAGKVRKVAFFTYKEPMLGVDVVARTLGIDIREYLFHTREDVVSNMLRAKAEGAEIGIGGVLVMGMREVCGLPGLLLEAGEDAVLRALREALSLASLRRSSLQRQARLHTILNTIAEGILVVDAANTLNLVNPTAEKLLGIRAEDALGKKAHEVVPNTRTGRVLETGTAEYGAVQDMGGATVVTSRVPILVDGHAVGVVCTFSEADRIQEAEQRLRGRLQAKGFTSRYTLDDIHTTSPTMIELKRLAGLYASTDATILLQGESGTGKELFAQGIHHASPRRRGPFVAVNCAAIPESLLESELFGYEEGAFTGARRQGKAGYFEAAHRGTLFLDEVSELPRPLQARLLRVLQEREVVRVGGSHVVPVDIRIVCATNRDLSAWTRQGQFREDLYYRLNVLTLHIPPLRQRTGDILYLAARFLGETETALSADITLADLLRAHPWPGNVRELANVMERLALVRSVMPGKPLAALFHSVGPVTSGDRDPSAFSDHSENLPLKEQVRRFEVHEIRRVLAQCGNDQTAAARQLGISRMSLWRKLHADGKGEAEG